QARTLINGLTARASLPAAQQRGRLEVATPEVCREVGGLLSQMPAELAGRVTTHLAESTNPSAHAALLIGMGSQDEEIRQICLTALVTLPFDRIHGLGAAARELQPRLFEQLREDGHWSNA